MNEKEKKDFYIAMCNCCLIAQALKCCPVCTFNVGLVEKLRPVDSAPTGIPLQVPSFSMSELG